MSPEQYTGLYLEPDEVKNNDDVPYVYQGIPEND